MPETSQNPYLSSPSRSFWRTAVASRSPENISELWQPKFAITDQMKVSTYGSCFAQHIGRNLDERGYMWFRPEGVPMGLSKADALTYNYGIFSSRTGNIYTTSLLHQWLSWADGSQQEPDEIWTQEGRTFDPFRPTVEPGGFDDAREMLMTRSETIKQFRTSVTDADLFVFTLGLTESWWNNEQGYEYPICPGTAAGDFDGSKHKFVNQDFGQVFEAMAKSLDQIRNLNPNIRVLLTVSPVPLTATATGGHVLVSTTYSKSVLRAVAGKLAQENDWVDYFPSYEIVTAPVFGGSAYADNQRSIRPEGVSFVMNHFFETIAPGVGHDRGAVTGPGSALATEEDVVCEEVLLDAFGPKK